MKALVVYDSRYGNTQKVANAIGKALGGEVKQVVSVDASRVKADLLIVGSPTHGGRPTEPVRNFLNALPSLHDVRVAAFDTRVPEKEQTFSLRVVMKVMGYASGKIAGSLQKKGGRLIAAEGFLVEDKEGPLRKGELARAARWASSLTRSI